MKFCHFQMKINETVTYFCIILIFGISFGMTVKIFKISESGFLKNVDAAYGVTYK